MKQPFLSLGLIICTLLALAPTIYAASNMTIPTQNNSSIYVTPGVAYLLATNETGIIAPLTSSVAFVNVTVNSTVSSNSTAGRRLLADPVVATLTQNFNQQVSILGQVLSMGMDTGSADIVVKGKGVSQPMNTVSKPGVLDLTLFPKVVPTGVQETYGVGGVSGFLYQTSAFDMVPGKVSPTQDFVGVDVVTIDPNSLADGLVGLSFQQDFVSFPGANPVPVPGYITPLQNLFTGASPVLANMQFTFEIIASAKSAAVTGAETGNIYYGGLAPGTKAAGITCVNLKRQPATEWVINLASVTSSPIAQRFSKNSDVLIDSGTAGLSLPPADLQALYNLLGLGPVMSGGLLFPVISCANIANLPTLTFTFSGTVNGGPPLALTLLPTDYVSQQGGVCSVPIRSVTASSRPSLWILGTTFFAANTPTFDVTPGAEAICFKNPAPPPVARCTPLVTLTVPPGQCTATFTQAALIALIDAGSTSPNSALTLSLQPLPSNGPSYILTQGQTYTFTLDATNTGGTSTCESFVTVKPVPLPVASCAPTLMLAATAKCEAHPDAATLLQAINAGSTGGTIAPILTPGLPAGSTTYNLPVGAYPISLTVANCAGSASCDTLVTVADEEPLDATKISCGALPSNGIVETPLLTKDNTTPVATYNPAYAKANGCPTTLSTDNLACRNCLVGSTKVQEGILDNCDSSISSKGVSILPKQIGRVAWTVTAEDQAGREATTDCAICADHGEKAFTTLGHCPNPFTTATACDFGNL